ncbi:putative DUF3176 domain protein [Rosellinia necatrix]|uniref:Putative DUF3176 domain protein n=1 Tax=Rosellinia necatrix TaxID=77044 RepID=A0A1W2THD1_ROSNE|nr:putative DUF3176 domain protein [Rosellinia necatrix]
MAHEYRDAHEVQLPGDVSNDQTHRSWSPARAASQTGSQRAPRYLPEAHEYSTEAMPFITPPQSSAVYSDREPQRADPILRRGDDIASGSQYEPNSRAPSPSAEEIPKLPQPSPKSTWNVWWFEIICILLGLGAFALIVAVLAWFDQRSLPNWPSQITLNTFVAFFTTLGKAAFMCVVPKAISQSQWTWFHSGRPLYDLHVFDQASRGAYGSLLLLYRLRFRHFAAVGALLMVFSFLTSPLTQLAISYPTREVAAATGQAKALAIRTISAPRDRLDLATRKAVLYAAVADGSHFSTPLEPLGTTCSTGNCTFNTYQSLGVCMKMANITSHLQVQVYSNATVGSMPLLGDSAGKSIIPGVKVWNASLGGGYDLVHQAPLAMATDMINGGASLGFAGDTNLLQAKIASFVLIYAAPLLSNAASRNLSANANLSDVIRAVSGFRYEAVEILYHACAQTYDSSVQMGVEKNRLVGELSEPVGLGDDLFLDMRCKSLIQDGLLGCETKPERWNEVLRLKDPVGGASAQGGTEFSANYQSMEMMASTLKGAMAGYARAQYHPKYYPKAEVYNGGGDLVQTLFQEVVYAIDGISNTTRRDNYLTNFYLNIATTVSSTIRVGQPQRFTRDNFNVTGQAWKEAPYVHITWGWFAFPAAELLLASILLVITMISQSTGSTGGNGPSSHPSGQQIPRDAKDSSLVTLVALSGACREVMGPGVRPMGELERAAKGVHVKLDGNELVPVVDGGIDQSRKV